MEKLNESKANLRKELEGLTIRMSQKLENKRKVEDIMKDKEHEISKLKQEISTITAYLQEGKEEKEEIQVDLNVAISQNETLMKNNDALSKKLSKTMEILAKFNQSATKLDQKLETMKPSKDNSRLGFSAYEEGETSGTKTGVPKEQLKPKINRSKGKQNFKPVCFNCLKEGHTANVCRSKAYNNFPYMQNNVHNHKARTSRFNGHYYACNKFGHRSFECRMVMNNPGVYAPRPRGIVQEPPMNWNLNQYRTYDLRSNGYEVSTGWRATYLIYCGSGHTAATCRRKNVNVNTGPWRAPGMVCYHCHKSGHISRICKLKKNPLGDIPVDLEGKVDMDKIWKNKFEEEPQDVPVSAPSVETSEPAN